jgi:hypothetical protein
MRAGLQSLRVDRGTISDGDAKALRLPPGCRLIGARDDGIRMLEHTRDVGPRTPGGHTGRGVERRAWKTQGQRTLHALATLADGEARPITAATGLLATRYLLVGFSAYSACDLRLQGSKGAPPTAPPAVSSQSTWLCDQNFGLPVRAQHENTAHSGRTS